MRILALDVGERRTGVAISDPSAVIARPLDAIHRGSDTGLCAAVAALVREHQAGAVVVGKPLGLDGCVGPQARRVGRFADTLREEVGVPVILWDERFSTARAEEILLETRGEKARRRARSDGQIDAIAAAVILQSFLDSQSGADQNGRQEIDRIGS